MAAIDQMIRIMGPDFPYKTREKFSKLISNIKARIR